MIGNWLIKLPIPFSLLHCMNSSHPNLPLVRIIKTWWIMLRSPAIAVPVSLRGQLDYIRSRWGDLLGHYLLKLLGSLKSFLLKKNKCVGWGLLPVRVPVYTAAGEMELERFSPDADWMPRLVMMAKNTYVWLDQLSKRYHQSITRLDQIPNEELDLLAQWGFTGLWLIGLWERSHASARIKTSFVAILKRLLLRILSKNIALQMIWVEKTL